MNYKTYEVKVYKNGDKHWYLNDQRHREDGAAVEYADGDKSWYLNSNKLTEKDFNAKMNSNNCHGKKILFEGKTYKLELVD